MAASAFGSLVRRGACSGWASAQPDKVLPDASTTNHMRWLGDNGPALMEVRTSVHQSPLTYRPMIDTMMAKGPLTSADQPCLFNANGQGSLGYAQHRFSLVDCGCRSYDMCSKAHTNFTSLLLREVSSSRYMRSAEFS